jgi:hypothetical protein
MTAFYEPLGDGRYRSTDYTRGPWDDEFQHAGPPSALLGRELERCAPRDDMLLARVTFDILGPVPVAEVELQARVIRPGRSVELLEAELRAGGRPAVTARAWRTLVTGAADIGDGARPAPPRPPAAEPDPTWERFGYGSAVELRFASGRWDRPGPATVWTRLRVPILPDEEPSGVQRVLAVADSGNGVSAVLDFERWLFINPELTVHFSRRPRGEWICLDAATGIASGGAGLATSVLSDDDGPVARGAQSLLVAPR